MNLSDFTQEELEKLLFLRASEWSDWPCYLAMGVGQLFLLNTHISTLLMVFIIAEIIWFFVAEKFVSFSLPYNLYWVHGLVWITSPVLAIILLTKGQILTSIIALLWFFILGIASFVLHLFLASILKPFKIFPPMIGIINLEMQTQIFEANKNEIKQKIREAKESRLWVDSEI